MRTAGRVLAVGAMLVAGVVRAEEKSPPPPSSNDASISSAKRDFDSLKQARDEALQQKGDLPRIATPELQTGSDNLPRPWLNKKDKDDALEKAKKRKSDNWLLEAMEKEKQREQAKDGEKTILGDARTEHETLSDGKTETTPLAADKADAPAAKEKDRDVRVMAGNPLARYMSDWMTPQDFALLGSSSAAAKDAGPSAVPGAAGAPANLGASGPGSGGLEASLSGLSFGGNASKSTEAAAPRENPFLQGVGPAGTAGPGSTLSFTPPAMPPPPPAPTPGSTSIFGPPPPEPAPRSNVPDFAKPADDAKALKPMKRF